MPQIGPTTIQDVRMAAEARGMLIEVSGGFLRATYPVNGFRGLGTIIADLDIAIANIEAGEEISVRLPEQ